jgi:hypothetical protein
MNNPWQEATAEHAAYRARRDVMPRAESPQEEAQRLRKILASQEAMLRRQKDAMFAKRIEANSRWLRIKAIRARLAELDAAHG